MVVNSSYDGYGMKTALSDNIKDVISYEYAREIELLQKKKHESLMSLKSCSLRRGRQTKGSMMRNKAIKKKMEEVQNPNDDNKFIYKLKQFINVPSSDYIRNIAKNQIKKRENDFSEGDLKYMRENAQSMIKNQKLEEVRNKSIENNYTLNKELASAQRNTTIGFPEINNRTLEYSAPKDQSKKLLKNDYLETISQGSKRSIGWHKSKASSSDYGSLKVSMNITDSVLKQNKSGSRTNLRLNDRYNDSEKLVNEEFQNNDNNKIRTIEVAQ